MPDALWSDAAGVTYTDEEDRRLIKAMYNEGIVTGLNVTISTGLNVTVAAGSAVVRDTGGSTGGSYLAYTTSDTSVAIPANTTRDIYIVVTEATAAVTIVAAASPPTLPSLRIGRAIAGASTITTADNVGSTRALPPNLSAGYLPLAGGTTTGMISAPRLHVSGTFDAVAGAGVNAPLGVRLGTGGYTARHMGRATGTSGNITESTWTRVNNLTTSYGNVAGSHTDYAQLPRPGTTPHGRFYAGVTGDYVVWGHVAFEANDSGYRYVRLASYKNSDLAGTNSIREIYGARIAAQNGANTWLPIPNMIRMSWDEYFVVEVYVTAGATATLNIVASDISFRLMQAG